MIQSVQRAHELMTAVAARPDGTGVRELARITGLKVPTAQGLLKTLAHCGLLHFDPDSRTYRIGMSTVRLAEAVPRRSACVDFVRPWVDSLYEELDATVVAAMLEEDHLVLSYWRRPEQVMAVAPFRDVIKHPHLLASGMVLMACQPPATQRRYAERSDLAALGPNLPRTAEEFLAEARQVRRQGYAERQDAAGSGVGALGVPVRDAAGAVGLSIAFSVPLTRYTAGIRERALQALQDAAAEMSAQLGATEDAPAEPAGLANRA